MHELALAQELIGILDQYVEEYELVAVNQITIQRGILSNVMPNALRFCFEATAQGTIYEAAELILEDVPVTVLCQCCGNQYTSEELPISCPLCNSTEADILGGTELVILNLSGESGEDDGN